MAIPLPCSSLGAGVRAGHRSAAESGSPRSLRSAREIPRGGLHAQKLFRYSFLRHSEYHPSAAAVWKAPAVISAIVPLKTGNVKWQFSTLRTAVPSISLQKFPLFLFVFFVQNHRTVSDFSGRRRGSCPQSADGFPVRRQYCEKIHNFTVCFWMSCVFQ